jgi:hypothetical protein
VLADLLAPPSLDDDPRVTQQVEDRAVEKLVTKLGVEALAIAGFPGTAGLDVGSLGI